MYCQTFYRLITISRCSSIMDEPKYTTLAQSLSKNRDFSSFFHVLHLPNNVFPRLIIHSLSSIVSFHSSPSSPFPPTFPIATSIRTAANSSTLIVFFAPLYVTHYNASATITITRKNKNKKELSHFWGIIATKERGNRRGKEKLTKTTQRTNP